MSEHTPPCIPLVRAEEQIRRTDETVDAVVSRVQVLVDQYHGQNVSHAEQKGDVKLLHDRMDGTRAEIRTMQLQWWAVVLAVLGGVIGVVLKAFVIK